MKLTARGIVETLQEKGFEAYWAGGCVRDMLLGITPKDFDIVTSATPDQIESIFEKTIPVGKQFGVIITIVDGHQFEIATFRSDAASSDGRRPDAVTFTNAKEDAIRRDFTINAIFYDPLKDEIIDYVDGQKDLDAKLIRFIGDPSARIEEDYLRILRAIRMKNTFQFQYHPDTYTEVKKHAHLVTQISSERVADELNKMILSPHPRDAFQEMDDVGVLQHIMPEMIRMKGVAQPYEYHHEGDVWEHAMRAIEAISPTATLEVRWATIFHDIGKPDTFTLKERIRFDHHASRSREIAIEILTRLKFPRRMIDHVGWLIEHHMSMVPLVEMPLKRRLHWFHHTLFLELMEVCRADAMGTDPPNIGLYKKIMELYHHDLADQPHRPEPLIDGKELMEITGIPPGPKVGKILQVLAEKQLTKEITTRDEAITWVKKALET